MFSKLALFITVTLAVCAIASPTPGGEPTDGGKCNTGPIQCCESIQKLDTAEASDVSTLLGINVEDITGQVGFECTPIAVVGAATGANCATEPVCCQKNYYNELVAINCTPVPVGA